VAAGGGIRRESTIRPETTAAAGNTQERPIAMRPAARAIAAQIAKGHVRGIDRSAGSIAAADPHVVG